MKAHEGNLNPPSAFASAPPSLGRRLPFPESQPSSVRSVNVDMNSVASPTISTPASHPSTPQPNHGTLWISFLLLPPSRVAQQKIQKIERSGKSPRSPSRNFHLPLSRQSNSEENSLLDHTHGASSNHRNQDTADASSITSFGNAEGNAGKAYGATGQDEQRQREEDEREREERERERLNAIAGQAGKCVPVSPVILSSINPELTIAPHQSHALPQPSIKPTHKPHTQPAILPPDIPNTTSTRCDLPT